MLETANRSRQAATLAIESLDIEIRILGVCVVNLAVGNRDKGILQNRNLFLIVDRW